MDEEKYKILLSNIDGQIDENGEAIVSLLNSERTGFSKHKLEFLKWLEHNANDVKDKVSSLILLVPNEYLPYNDFAKINDFYRATKGTLNTTLAVVHTYDSCKILVKKLWNIETIIRANLYIQSIVNNIKKSNLSPAEALAYIHFKVSSIVKYTPSARQSSYSNDQLFVGAFLKKPEFVCAGYASLEKQIIDALNMDGLKCTKIGVSFQNNRNRTFGRHARLKIEMDDPKYKIKGHFYSDPTWDIPDIDKAHKYCHLLMPKNYHDYGLTKYYYYNFDEYNIVGQNDQVLNSYNPRNEGLTEPNDPLPQKTLETIMFCALAKAINFSYPQLVMTMKKMAQASFREQRVREYKGSLKSEELSLTLDEMKELYDKAKLEKSSKAKVHGSEDALTK